MLLYAFKRIPAKSAIIINGAVVITILFLMITTASFCQYQPTPVEKSDQKIIFQGKTYYVHTVKHGQTVYSICKAYGITQQMLADANPGVTLDPLSTGQVLKIPSITETRPIQQQPVAGVKEDASFIYHTVQPKETIYFLHQKYNVSLETIYKYNPGAENGIHEGDIIRLPKAAPIAETSRTGITHQETIKKYTVRQGDSLYRIAEDNGLTIGDIINANRELRWGLKPGQIIIIPTAEQAGTGVTGLYDTLVQVTSKPVLTAYQCDSIASLKRMHPAIKVALLLPFFAKEEYTSDTLLDSDSISDNGIRTERKTFRGIAAVEFYEGFLLAVDTLKKNNVAISLFVYDTEADTIKVKSILRDLAIVEPDIIIGPFTNDNTRLVSKFSFEHQIPLVPPLFMDDSTQRYNPLLIQTIPSHRNTIDSYARYIARFNKKNIILVTKPGLQYRKENELFRKQLKQEARDQYGVDSLKINEVEINDATNRSINKLLKKDVENIVVIFSEYEPDVINVMSHLHFMLRDYTIEVFGLPQWQRFDNVRIEVMHELQVTLYTPFYIDYDNPRVKSFIKTCRSKLKYEPFKTTAKGTGINYAYLGYDMGVYFLGALYNYQKNICECLPYKKEKLLLSDYDYQRDNNQSNLINRHITLLRFNKDYEVQVVDFK